jgi:hypothetical protein
LIRDFQIVTKKEMELTGSGKQAVVEEPSTSVVFSMIAKP